MRPPVLLLLALLAGCDGSARHGAGEARLDRAAQNAITDEQRVDAGIEANIRAAAAANADDDLAAGTAADSAFLANLDAERNATVAAALKNGADQARRAQLDNTMHDLATDNDEQP